MKIINPSYEILNKDKLKNILKDIESAGRICYKSEDRITDDSADNFTMLIVASGHHSVLEHSSISIKFICDRGVSHELVRHRLMAISQESTRYCDYSKDKFDKQLTFIRPCFWDINSNEYRLWALAMKDVELYYMSLKDISGCSAQQARTVLPNSLKTELVCTANLREWRHILDMRAAKYAHPQMQELMKPLLIELYALLPTAFMDLYIKHIGPIVVE